MGCKQLATGTLCLLATSLMISMLCGQNRDAKAIIAAASKHLQERNPTAAIALLEPLVEREPKNWLAWFRLGNAYIHTNRRALSIVAHREAFRLAPDRFAIPQSIGWTAYQMDRYEESVEYSRMALALRPDDRYSRCNLALALLRLGKVTAARDEYTVALRHFKTPDDLQLIAIDDLQAALREQPKLPGADGLLDMLRAHKARLPQAENQ